MAFTNPIPNGKIGPLVTIEKGGAVIGAIAGDIIGSVYERFPIKTKDFALFDTLACITGGIAEAFYGEVSSPIRDKVKEILTPDLWEITEKFCSDKIKGLNNDVHGS